MTITEFDNTGFTGQMLVTYDGKSYDLVSVDFQEKLIAINDYGSEDGVNWKRCENVELLQVGDYIVTGTAEIVKL